MAGTTSGPLTERDSGYAHQRRLTAVLAVTQTVGYGVLLYAFSVLLTPIAFDLGASTAAVAGAATVAILVGATAGIVVGRWLDRRGGRAIMTAGSVLGVAAVLAWSQVQTVGQLYAVFGLIGLASAGSLYEAAFAVVFAVADGGRRDRMVLAITIVAGFASSIFMPLTGWLVAGYGWRATLIVLAGLLAVTAVPGHLWAVPAGDPHRAGARRRRGVPVREALSDRAFWALTGALVVHAAAGSAFSVLLVAFLLSAGHPTSTAATIAGLLGVLSVTGRLAITSLARRYGMVAMTALVFAIQAVGAGALPYLADSLVWTAACVLAFGLGFGVPTLARPAILADRYGTHRYATIAATMLVPISLARAGAPVGAAFLGTDRFLHWVAAACLLSAGMLWTVARADAVSARAMLRPAPPG